MLQNLPILGDLTGVVRYVQQTESLIGTCEQLPITGMDKYEPSVSRNNLSSFHCAVESQTLRQRLVQYAETKLFYLWWSRTHQQFFSSGLGLGEH